MSELPKLAPGPIKDVELAGCRVLLRRIDAPSHFPGTQVQMPQAQQTDWRKASKRCIVLKLGPGQLNKDEDGFLPLCPMGFDGKVRPTSHLKVGDEVVIADYGYTEVEVNGETLIILSAEDVKGIIRR